LPSDGKIVLSFRQPFYIYDSDVSLYQKFSPPDEVLANTAHPLRFSVK
jgi:hypothetical protein